MYRRPHPITLCLALCAVAWAQVFGVQRGYVCEHNGKTVATMADHHHMGDALHADHFENYSPHHHEDDEDEDTERHAPLKVEMSVPQLPGTFTIQAIDWVDCTLCDFLSRTLVPMVITRQISVPPHPGGLSPPASLVVAQCMVLMV
ncbi:MAG: hypothetical protein U0984_15685 [Prosthecobacter sp.]|nr:hypothetical protein [Prosthecobacter sp.]